MKVLVVLVLFGALAAAIPTPSDEVKSVEQPQNEQNHDALLSADANPQSDNAQSVEGADRSKRFIFFSKIFYPYPAAYSYTPVVTPIVVPKTKVVAAPAPVAYTYKVKPVTYQYTYSVPQFTIVKAAPIVKTVQVTAPQVVKSVAVAAPAVSVTKTVATASASDDEDGYRK